MTSKTPPELEDDYSTIQETAKRWKVSPRTVRRLIDSGKLKSVKIGNQHRISGAGRRAYERSQRS